MFATQMMAGNNGLKDVVIVSGCQLIRRRENMDITIAGTYVNLAIRHSDMCAGCGNTKQIGAVVCWECWSRPEGGLKWWGGTLADWLLRQENLQRIKLK